jgi:glycine/D-amino acid oxidase-like deaminating enzyme
MGALHTASDGRAEPQKAVPALARRARELGAKIVTQCAVRGIETKAGRVAAAVTERGTIACGSVVLAGGAWSRLFCRNLDLTLPQLKVIASVMRVDGVSGGPESAALSSGFAFRKRADGGYTVTGGTGTAADIVPDSFRFFRMFLPLAAAERRHTRLRLGPRFIEELRQPARWRLDAVSPFERVRILDPQPAHTHLEAGLRNLQTVFPAFKGRDDPPELGRRHRCDAGRHPRHFRRRRPARIPYRHGLLRPRLRHRPRRRAAHGRHRHRPPTDRDPSAFRFSRFSDGSRLEFFTGL